MQVAHDIYGSNKNYPFKKIIKQDIPIGLYAATKSNEQLQMYIVIF